MQEREHPLLSATLGSTRSLTSFHYGPDRAQGGVGKVYVQAALHADELPGMLVAHHLRERLAAVEAAGRLRGEVVVVPVANPIGIAQGLLRGAVGRFELASGENFNRHFPALVEPVWARVASLLDGEATANVARVRAALRGAVATLPAATELASLRRALLALACDADLVLDLHCDSDAVLHLYTAPASWPAVEPLARLLGCEVCLLADDGGDQPFEESCATPWHQLARRAGPERPLPAGCVAVTVELRGMTDIRTEVAQRDAQALVDYLAQRGFVDAAPAALPAARCAPTPLAGSITLNAPASGVIAWRLDPGAMVREGDPLGELVDPIAGTVTVLASPTSGCFYARETRRFASAGMPLAKVAGREARRSGKLLSD